ncbi:unnamed protein product, partial [Effrenium voratum]
MGARARGWPESLKLLDALHQRGLEATMVATSSCLGRLAAGEGTWRHSLRLLRTVRLQRPNAVPFNAACTGCGRAKEWQRSFQSFEVLRWDGVLPTAITCSALITACAVWATGMLLFLEIARLRLAPDLVALNAAAKSADWDLALRLMGAGQAYASRQIGLGLRCDAVFATALVTGVWRASLAAWQLLRQVAMRLNLIHLNSVVFGLGQGQQWERAASFSTTSLQLDAVTLSAKLTACCEGLQWEAALRYRVGGRAIGPERLSALEDRGIILEETEDNGHAEAVDEASDEPKKKPQKSEKSLKSLQSEKSEKVPKLPVRFDELYQPREPQVDGQGVLEVYVDESVWSVFFVVGLERSVFNGFLDSFIAGLLTLVNLVVQILFLGVILSEDFLGEPFESKKSAARLWRSFVAHDARHLDLAGTSLASRVCGQDGALIVANAQASLVEEINSYLNLQPDQFNTDGFRPGAVLCMLCILIWSVFVIRELRTYLQSFLGLLTLRRGGLSVLTQGSEIVSYQRLGLLILVHLCRVVMAIWLLYAGILWLASTTSIADLILNCVALEAR